MDISKSIRNTLLGLEALALVASPSYGDVKSYIQSRMAEAKAANRGDVIKGTNDYFFQIPHKDAGIEFKGDKCQMNGKNIDFGTHMEGGFTPRYVDVFARVSTDKYQNITNVKYLVTIAEGNTAAEINAYPNESIDAKGIMYKNKASKFGKDLYSIAKNLKRTADGFKKPRSSLK